MASIKTIVRELGVLYWTDRILNDDVIKAEDVEPNEFYQRCDDMIGSTISEANKIQGKDKFRSNKVEILQNTYWLSKRLIETLDINKIEDAKWIGPDTQRKEPVDIILNGERISLKEDSYILENMGLYKLINLLTDSNYNSGSWHIFEDFASEEYEEWFYVSWNFLLDVAEDSSDVLWEDNTKDYDRKIVVEGEKLKLIYKDRTSILPLEEITIESYTNKTISKTREVFGKWLNEVYLEEIASNSNIDRYNSVKKNCAVTAGKNLKRHLTENLEIKYENLLRLLQVYDKDYYYAKAADGKSEIFYVPSIENYDRENLEIPNFEISVPDSQLNFITTVKNNEDGDELKLRNEIRFSHRQFNGSPEAKMYIVENYDLSPVYKEIETYDYRNKSLENSIDDFI